MMLGIGKVEFGRDSLISTRTTAPAVYGVLVCCVEPYGVINTGHENMIHITTNSHQGGLSHQYPIGATPSL